jgi:hypothetical protein
MDARWTQLPNDIINCILQYDGRITYRTGMYINKILDVDTSYPLLLERMRFQRYRRFYIGVTFVTIILPTEKQICYWATNKGVRITLFSPTDEHHTNMIEEQLFTNVDQ